MNLFNPEKTFIGKARNVLAAFAICVIWAIIITALTTWLNGERVYQRQDNDQSMLFTLLFSCIIPPLWEELKYRVVYLQLGKYIDNAIKAGNKVVTLAIILSSLDFGWGHGHMIWSILMQGVFGFIFAGVYIKNGYSYWSSVTLHFMWNTFVIFGTHYL